MSYFSYHNHTDMSNLRLIDSINTTEGVLDRAFNLGLKGVAITDHETLSSFVRAEKYLQKKRAEDPRWEELKFVRGSEIYLTRNGLTKETAVKGEKYYHFILLAKDYIGYKQLVELSSRAWGRGFKLNMLRVPTYWSDLEEVIGSNPGHVVASTACLGSEIGSKWISVLNGDTKLSDAREWSRDWLNTLSSIFGKNNVVIELQPGVSKEQIFVNKALHDLAVTEDYLFTITTDTHYLTREDRDAHRAFLKSKNGEREVDEFYEATYMMDIKDIHERMDKHIGTNVVDQALKNTLTLLDRFEEYSLLRPLKIPYLPKEQFDVPFITERHPDYWSVLTAIPNLEKYFDSDELADKQFASRLYRFMVEKGEEIDTARYLDTKKASYLDKELGLIWDSGQKQHVSWSKYFLQVADYVNLWWNVSIIAPGRGSAGASYVSFILGIIQIDPTREKAPLLLERFMNPDRASVLDIDIDVASNKRDEAIALLQATYGVDHVTRVATFRTTTAKSAIQTAAKAVGMDIDEARFISGLIPAERGIVRTLKQTYYGDEEQDMKSVREFVKQMNMNPELWQVAQSIEGLVVGLGSHAGGVIISEEPITEYCGLMKTTNGDMITSYDLHELEDLGLIKIDALATTALQKIQTTIELLLEYGYLEDKGSLKANYEQAIGVYNLDRDNPEMWDLANDGKIIALFQMEQMSGVEGMRIIRPRSVEELAILNSTIRLTSEHGQETPVEKFQRFTTDKDAWKNEMEAFDLTEEQQELLRDMLDYSHGMAVHQEDLYSLMAHPDIAGFPFGVIDRLRKAIAKKVGNEFDIFEEQYYQNAKDKNLEPNLVRYVWEKLIKPLRGYGFRMIESLHGDV